MKTIEENEEEERYRLSEWGCLSLVLKDYRIDVNYIPGKVGKHIVEDFMELMCEAGYIGKAKED